MKLPLSDVALFTGPISIKFHWFFYQHMSFFVFQSGKKILKTFFVDILCDLLAWSALVHSLAEPKLFDRAERGSKETTVENLDTI